MNTKLIVIILFCFVIFAHAAPAPRAQQRPLWSRLRGWQKVFAIAGMLMTLLIVLNPEFLALGLVGDTALFDALVLFLGLQLQNTVARYWRAIATWTPRVIRLLVPRNNLIRTSTALIMAAEPLIDGISAVRKSLIKS